MPQETNANFDAIDCNFSITVNPNGFINQINSEDPQEEWWSANNLTSIPDDLFDAARVINEIFCLTHHVPEVDHGCR